MMINF